jgi:hypothetical protein
MPDPVQTLRGPAPGSTLIEVTGERVTPRQWQPGEDPTAMLQRLEEIRAQALKAADNAQTAEELEQAVYAYTELGEQMREIRSRAYAPSGGIATQLFHAAANAAPRIGQPPKKKECDCA